MEVVAEDQGPMGLEHELRHAGTIPIFDQEDEFDFTIGGEDDLDANTGDYSAQNAHVDESDETEHRDEISLSYEGQEQGNTANVVLATEKDDQYNDEEDNEMLELDVDVTEVTDLANEMDESNEIEHAGSSSGLEAAVQDNTEEPAEDIAEEGVYYQEMAKEFETFDNDAQDQPDHSPDYMEQSTSVENVSGNEETQKTDNESAVYADELSGTQAVKEDVKNTEAGEVLTSGEAAAFDLEAGEPAEGEVLEEEAQYVSGEFGGGEPGHDGDDQEQQSSRNASIADLADEVQQEQGSWDEEEHDNEVSDTRPKITVSYQSREYSLFAESSDQDPDYFFLADLDSLHQPLSQLLASIREVISDEIAASQEVFLRVNGLGFEFAESTTKDFLDETTFAQIVEVNRQLIDNEGGSPSSVLHCYLGLRPSCLQRFSELSKAAEEGKGLSDIAMFYDDASVEESAEEIDEHDFSQDMISESPSLDGALADSDDNNGENFESNGVEQYRNPFRTTEEQFPKENDATVPNTVEDEFAEEEEVSAEALGIDGAEFEAANAFENPSGGTSDEFENNTAETLEYARDPSWNDEGAYDQPTAEDTEVGDLEQNTEAQTDLYKDNQGDVDGETFIFSPRSACGTVDLCLCFECLRPHFMDLDGLWPLVPPPEMHTSFSRRAHFDGGAHTAFNIIASFAQEGDKTAEHIEIPRRDLKADSNHQDPAPNPDVDKNDNDDDYLDLGEDEGDDGSNAQPMDSAIPAKDESVKPSVPAGMSPQMSHHSSATATLDGEDHGFEDTAASSNQNSMYPGDAHNDTDNDLSNGEVDEIDWNHDEEGDLDDANQNPTTLSPSSPSAKRSREEDETTDGTGDENGGFCLPNRSRTRTDKVPAIKRRRT